jgi:hypothetical protein
LLNLISSKLTVATKPVENVKKIKKKGEKIMIVKIKTLPLQCGSSIKEFLIVI